ncbi:MAG: hypothetical protein AB7F59_15265 [Bdellovibrionales bacterium]
MLTPKQKEMAEMHAVWTSLNRDIPLRLRTVAIEQPETDYFFVHDVVGLFPNGDLGVIGERGSKIQRVPKDAPHLAITTDGTLSKLLVPTTHPSTYTTVNTRYRTVDGAPVVAKNHKSISLQRLKTDYAVTDFCHKSPAGTFHVGDSVAVESQKYAVPGYKYFFGKIIGIFKNGDYAFQPKSFNSSGPHIAEKFQHGQLILQDPTLGFKEYGIPMTDEALKNDKTLTYNILRIPNSANLELVRQSSCRKAP